MINRVFPFDDDDLENIDNSQQNNENFEEENTKDSHKPNQTSRTNLKKPLSATRAGLAQKLFINNIQISQRPSCPGFRG